MQQTSSPSTVSPSLVDCLKLLNGERDEQKLAGLLLATKFCHVGDIDSVIKVYNAVGNRFLNRLLMTGMGKGADNSGNAKSIEERDAFLKLSITVISGFCRVPEIAALKEMVDKVHDVSEIISYSLDQTIIEECYEFLLLVATASQNGKNSFFEPGVMDMLASHVSTAKDDAQSLELAIRLLQLLFNKQPIDTTNEENVSGLSHMVAAIARQFAVLHNALKFDALHLLTVLLSPKDSLLHDALRLMTSEKNWTSHIRLGITAVLQNRVVSEEKLQALLLAESMMSIVGEDWLAKHIEDDNHSQMSNNKFILLVLETARVEVAVLLNELAYAKYEAVKSAATDESIILKEQNLAVTFSLLEKIIRLISNASGLEGSLISESTLMKVIGGLNETINLVLDFLQDSKDHGQRKGDDLLAAVRIIGSYLAETPFACKEKTQSLLAYMLSVEGVDETSPFYSICFLLPLLCQITVEKEGCKLLILSGAHKIIVECLIKMIGSDGMAESCGTILLACETIINILLKIKELKVHVEQIQIVRLLCALALWTENSKDSTTIMMVACITALIFDLTSEETLFSLPNLDRRIIERLSQAIAFSLTQVEETSYDVGDHLHLQEIVTSGYDRWADRFPLVKRTVDASMQDIVYGGTTK